jgi:hypothetical protein
MRPEDDPPRLVVTVVMDTEQMLRMRLFWIVSPNSSTASKALFGKNTRGVLKSVDRALGVGQSATADQSVDNSELGYAAAHGFGPISGFVCDSIEQKAAMGRERRLAEPRDEGEVA